MTEFALQKLLNSNLDEIERYVKELRAELADYNEAGVNWGEIEEGHLLIRALAANGCGARTLLDKEQDRVIHSEHVDLMGKLQRSLDASAGKGEK